MAKPHIQVPSSITDRSRPLPEYFISSSHNTYLVAHQLYGSSTAIAYETALKTGARCVEIDAWDDENHPDEPKVTHGFTLASNIPFRNVCETIRDVIDDEAKDTPANEGYRPSPIMISLENHCNAHGQKRLAEIMKEVWGSRLVGKRVREEGHREQMGSGEHVTLEELGSKICVIVEYHFPQEEADSDSSSSSDEDGEDAETMKARKEYQQKKKNAPTGIIPELAELGVYAQSVKPRDKSWLRGDLKEGPHHHLINVSESALSSLMPADGPNIGRHNSQNLMRVYPKGTRISSRNLSPVPYWGVGAQICALNWQTFDASVQLNEALFAGTDGYVLKPAALRSGGSTSPAAKTVQKKRLRLHIAGATDVPIPEGREADSLQPYVTCTLIQPHDLTGDPPKRKTSGYKQHKLALWHKGENPPPTEPIWDEVLEWEYDGTGDGNHSGYDGLSFLRILIKSDDRLARNPKVAVVALRLAYVVTGQWRFVRMMDLKARQTKCSLLVKFEVGDM